MHKNVLLTLLFVNFFSFFTNMALAETINDKLLQFLDKYGFVIEKSMTAETIYQQISDFYNDETTSFYEKRNFYRDLHHTLNSDDLDERIIKKKIIRHTFQLSDEDMKFIMILKNSERKDYIALLTAFNDLFNKKPAPSELSRILDQLKLCDQKEKCFSGAREIAKNMEKEVQTTFALPQEKINANNNAHSEPAKLINKKIKLCSKLTALEEKIKYKICKYNQMKLKLNNIEKEIKQLSAQTGKRTEEKIS